MEWMNLDMNVQERGRGEYAYRTGVVPYQLTHGSDGGVKVRVVVGTKTGSNGKVNHAKTGLCYGTFPPGKAAPSFA